MSEQTKPFHFELEYLIEGQSLIPTNLREFAEACFAAGRRVEQDQLAARDAELLAAVEALEKVEWLRAWADDPGGFCPWCGANKPTHAPDCPRQRVLSGERAAKLAELLAAVGDTLADFSQWQRTTKDGRDIQQVFQPLYKAWYAAYPVK